MKKIIYSLFLLLMFSCSLDKMPTGSMPVHGGITNIQDAQKLENYLNVLLRTIYSGSAIYNNELMSDLFNQTVNYGNRGGAAYRMNFTASESEVADMWEVCYLMNDHANYCNGVIENLLKSPEISKADSVLLYKFRGETAFAKAVAMFELVQRYSPAYSSNSAQKDFGAILSDVHDPTSDYRKYSSRSTLQQTYDDILKNISLADSLLANSAGREGSAYITIDVVKAFQARVALTMGDYKTAAKKSAELIESEKYPLIESKEDFANLWLNDSGRECIMQLEASFEQNSLPESIAYGYSTTDELGVYKPDYIPQQWIVDLYRPTDMRFALWFEKQDLVYGAIRGDAVIFNKFPGNRKLQAEKKLSDFIHKIKPFRIAEQYLIAAEACLMLGDADGSANYLNTLRKKRDPDAIIVQYSGAMLKDEIKRERVRELIGEGFRFLDLKRYRDDMIRKDAQNISIVYDPLNTSSALLKVGADDYRFVWPIPQSEIDANPQIRKQQNKGY